MKTTFVAVAVLASLASASPAALRQTTTDAFSFSGSTSLDNPASSGHHSLVARATLQGDCSREQRETVRRALYNCYRVAGRAAAVADTNHKKLKEFFRPDSETNTERKYTARVANVVTSVFEKVQKACGEAEGKWSTAVIYCERNPGRQSGCHVPNTLANTIPNLRYPDGRTPHGTIAICPAFFNPRVADLVNEDHPETMDRAMLLIHEMTKIAAIRGTREITPVGRADDIIGMGASTALGNAASYAFFAQAVKYPEEHWTPFPGIH